MTSDTAGYREYAAANLDRLRRTAYLLCGDPHPADDLVSTALVKLFRHWRRVSAMEHIDAYVRQMMLRALLDERRRPWRRERFEAVVPDGPMPDEPSRVDDRLAVLDLLAELPPRRRAVVVLRYFCDLSVEETARELGCSTGTVKSQTARALDSLRARSSAATAEGEALWN